MQHELPILGPVRGIERAPAHEVALCRTSGQAVGLAILKSRKSQQQVADAIGMDKAQLSRILHGSHHFPADLGLALARATHSCQMRALCLLYGARSSAGTSPCLTPAAPDEPRDVTKSAAPAFESPK